jgi:hypothetical protein
MGSLWAPRKECQNRENCPYCEDSYTPESPASTPSMNKAHSSAQSIYWTNNKQKNPLTEWFSRSDWFKPSSSSKAVKELDDAENPPRSPFIDDLAELDGYYKAIELPRSSTQFQVSLRRKFAPDAGKKTDETVSETLSNSFYESAQSIVVDRECSVCGNSYPLELFHLPSWDCTHDSNCCRTCLQNWIKSQLETKGWDKICCPENECEEILQVNDIQRCALAETYEA